MFTRAQLAVVCCVGACLTSGTRPVADVHSAHGDAQFRRLPIRFEPNVGQWDERVRFVARDHDATLFLTDEGATIGARGAAITMKLVGAKPSTPVGEHPVATKSNFFLGSDSKQWRTSVTNYAEVRAHAWVPGVDVVWHGGEHALEYDVEVAARVDARELAFEIDGANGLDVLEDGSLEIVTTAGALVQRAPNVLQDDKRLRTRYVKRGEKRFGFDIDDYDATRALLIDPVLGYSTYLGGTDDDRAEAIAVDGSGNAYVTGATWSTNFPIVSAYQGTFGGGSTDVFVTKLDSSGAVVYSTFIGGNQGDTGYGLAVDGSGNVYLTGFTQSTNFPTVSAYQGSLAGNGNAFVTKLDASGSALTYSTYLGGNSYDHGAGIAVDGSGNAVVAGYTTSTNFPTANAYQNSNGGGDDGFVTKLSASGSTLTYSTYLGGTLNDWALGVAVDGSGNAYVTGNAVSTNFPTANAYQGTSGGGTNGDAFVTKLSATGSLTYSTYLGGKLDDAGMAIAVDSAGSAYVTGSTISSNFPTANAYQGTANVGDNAFVTKLSANGSALVYSTFLAGSGGAQGMGIGVDSSGNAYVTGIAGANFPIASAYQSVFAGGTFDAFVTELNAAGSGLTYSTYLGGSGQENVARIAVDSSGSAYLTGFTTSTNFPTASAYQAANAGGLNDSFVAKLEQGSAPLTLFPTAAAVAPNGAKTFAAFGGSGAGYTYSLQTNASGGSINASSGAYTAGATANVVDVVELTDSNNDVATAKVNVGPGVSISPAAPSTPPNGSVSFTATGGSDAGYTWSLPTSNSGGSIAASGDYTAGATPNVSDTVQVTDSLGNTATTNVAVTAGVSIAPPSPSVPPLGVVAFTASGGSGNGYVWFIATNKSGASINASTGAYTAGQTANVSDTVQVTDSLNNAASVVVTVTKVAPNGDGGVAVDAGDASSDGGVVDGGSVTGGSGSCGCTVVDAPTSDGRATLLFAATLLALWSRSIRRVSARAKAR